MEKLTKKQSIDLISRICISAIFINAIPLKISKFNNVVQFISSRGIPDQLSVLLLISSILVLISGTSLLLLSKYQKEGASLLLLFIIPTTIIFHLTPLEPRALLMNLGLIGGLLLIINRE